MGRATTVGELGEAGLLLRLRRLFGGPAPGVIAGIGDDAALLRAVGPTAVLSSDLLIEGEDFDFAWARHADVGHKAAAVNLSDLAAMGAKPRALLLSLGLRRADAVADVLALVRGMARLGRSYGAPLVGGDLSGTRGPMVVSVTAVGQVHANRALRRHAARPGDVVLVSGALGAAAAGLHHLQQGGSARAAAARRQLRPTPRVELGEALRRWGRVRAAADVSDGIASDALHLAADGCGVELDAASVPVAAAARRAFGPRALDMALTGGEDFELAVAVRRRDVAAARRFGLTSIGRVVPGVGLRLSGSRSVAAGFDHFRKR